MLPRGVLMVENPTTWLRGKVSELSHSQQWRTSGACQILFCDGLNTPYQKPDLESMSVGTDSAVSQSHWPSQSETGNLTDFIWSSIRSHQPNYFSCEKNRSSSTSLKRHTGKSRRRFTRPVYAAERICQCTVIPSAFRSTDLMWSGLALSPIQLSDPKTWTGCHVSRGIDAMAFPSNPGPIYVFRWWCPYGLVWSLSDGTSDCFPKCTRQSLDAHYTAKLQAQISPWTTPQRASEVASHPSRRNTVLQLWNTTKSLSNGLRKTE